MIEICSGETIACMAAWAGLPAPDASAASAASSRDWFDYLTLIVGTLSAFGTVAAAWTAVLLARAQTRPSLALEVVPFVHVPGSVPEMELRFLNTGLMPVMVRNVELWCGWLPYFRLHLDIYAENSINIVLPIKVEYGHTEIRFVWAADLIIKLLSLRNWGKPTRVEHHSWIARRLRFVVKTSTGHRFVCPAPDFVQQIVTDAYASQHGEPRLPPAR